MKIFAISDLHLSFTVVKPMDVFGEMWVDHFKTIEKNWNSVVTDEDIVLLAGDLSWAMEFDMALADLAFLSRLRGRKIIIKGNHDYWWSSYSKVKSALPDGVFAIQNNAVKIGNTVFAGTRGWTVAEKPSEQTAEDKKVFDREVIRLEMSLTEAKKLMEEGDNLIVMTHYPPFNNRTEDSAVTGLLEKYGVNKVVYGHIHGKQPYYKRTFLKNGITYYLTTCDALNFYPALIQG